MTKRVNQRERLRKIFYFTSVFCLLSMLTGTLNVFAASSNKSAVLLILPFQVSSKGDMQQIQKDFPIRLGDQIASNSIQVISNQRALSLLNAKNVSTLDVATVKRLARSAGATHALYGSINKVGTTFSIDARLVSISGGSPKPFFVDPSAGGIDVTSAINTLAIRLSSELAPKGNLTAVEVRGTNILDPEVVLLRISTHVGDNLNPSAIDAYVKKIWDLGYFSDVSVSTESRDKGIALIYTVKERPRVESIRVEGEHALDEEDIISILSTKTGNILNDKLLSEDIQKIIESYRKKGYYLAKVNTQTALTKDGLASTLTITIDEGKKLYISQVNLVGVQKMDVSDVKGKMLLTERGFFSWISGTGVLKEELIERDSSAITSYYLDHGFLDVAVGSPDITYEEKGIIVSFPINEGERYRLGTVTFAGDLIDTSDKLSTVTLLDKKAATHDYFNLSIMQEDAKNLADFYSDQGYAYAEVNPTPEKQAENTVNVTYHIDKGNKYYVGRTTVEGNNRTRDNVILREMRLTDGDAFEGSKLRRSSERLNKLGLFELAEVELVPTTAPDEVDLKVKVKEKPTGALQAGVGYSTFSSVGVAGTLMEKNLFGKGYSASLQANVSGRRTAYTFSFVNPRWDDTDLSIATSLYHWKDDYIDYTKQTTGAVIRASYPIGEYTSIGLGYRFDIYKLYDFEDDASALIKKYDTGNRFSSVGLARIIRDSTDSYNPTSGNIDSISFDYGGGILGGDDNFFTVTLEHQSFYELWKNNVLHAKLLGSAIYKNGSSEIPVFERFWLGGIGTVRGYNSRNIVPRDKATGDHIGGTRMGYANLEYIWTVSEEMGIALVPFFDVGFDINTDVDYKWKDEIFRSYGTELRWRSPLGDLRFSYGIPLDEDRKGKKRSGRFEFSMGSTF